MMEGAVNTAFEAGFSARLRKNIENHWNYCKVLESPIEAQTNRRSENRTQREEGRARKHDPLQKPAKN